MATAAPAQHTDKDLASVAEARALARRAKEAQALLAEFSQAQVDAIVDAMAAAVTPQAESLARLHELLGAFEGDRPHPPDRAVG